MLPRYERNLPSLTMEESELLRTKTVAVIGCGGLGGYIIEQLARLGVGTLRIVDGDVFEESNLNRQLFSDVNVLGQPKTEVSRARIAAVNPEVYIQSLYGYLGEDNAEAFLDGCDAVVGALDNIYSRRVIEKTCEKLGIPYVYGAIHGWVAQAAVDMPGQRLIEKMYPEGSTFKDKSSLSFTPGLCASLQTALCVKYLVGRPVQTGTIFYFDMLEQEFETIPMVY